MRTGPASISCQARFVLIGALAIGAFEVAAAEPREPEGVRDPGQVAETVDAPFRNELDPQEDVRRKWNVGFSWSGAHETDSSGIESVWDGSLSRNWNLDRWTPSAQVQWSRSASTNRWDLGGGLDADLTDELTWENAFDWEPVRDGADDWTAATGGSWASAWGDVLEPDASANLSWNNASRGDVQLQAGMDANWERLSARASGTWDWKRRTYLDAAGRERSEYGNVWGWWLQMRCKGEKWSTGPIWTGDFSKVESQRHSQAATRTSKAGKAPKIPKESSAGNLLEQEFRWNLSWSPLPLLSISVDVFRTEGVQFVQVRSGSTPLRKATLSKGAGFDQLPTESTGARLSVGLCW